MVSGGLRLLLATRRRVAQSWCRGADARDAAGVEVDPWSDDARSWSLLGALVAALEAEAIKRDELPLDELAEGLYALAGLIDTGSLSEWNDDPARTQAGVLEILDRAIAASRTPPLPLLLSPN
jgi:hypothetical protein